VPNGLIKAGFNDDIFSIVDTLMPKSLLTGDGLFGKLTGAISLRYPFFVASSANLCDRNAKSSCSRRVTPKLAANLSPE
jgi:hypothetical protein